MQPKISSNVHLDGEVVATIQYLGATDNHLTKITLLIDFGENYGTPYCPEALDSTFLKRGASGMQYDRDLGDWTLLRGEIPWKTTKALVTLTLDKRLGNPQNFVRAKAKKLAKWMKRHIEDLPTREELEEDMRRIEAEEEELYYRYHSR